MRDLSRDGYFRPYLSFRINARAPALFAVCRFHISCLKPGNHIEILTYPITTTARAYPQKDGCARLSRATGVYLALVFRGWFLQNVLLTAPYHLDKDAKSMFSVMPLREHSE